MHRLSIRLFGAVRISRGARRAPIRVVGRPRDLFAFLLLHRDRLHTRDVLATLFWGDQSERSARSCLSTVLWRLRACLEPPGTPRGAVILTGTGDEVGFNSAGHWLDIAEFERAVLPVLARRAGTLLEPGEAEALSRAGKLYRGDLLEGCYYDWALVERERFQLAYLTVLELLMQWHREQGQLGRSLSYALRILQVDPLRESIHREVMRLYVRQGQRALAVRHYERCRELLQAELGIPPMDETMQLFAEIVGGERQAASSAQPAGPAPRPPRSWRSRTAASLRSALTQMDSARAKVERAAVELSGGEEPRHSHQVPPVTPL
jgi:DNA-binding SARP family transcriptional activator